MNAKDLTDYLHEEFANLNVGPGGGFVALATQPATRR